MMLVTPGSVPRWAQMTRASRRADLPGRLPGTFMLPGTATTGSLA